ncbi:MAG: MerR family transcriptional regulator [Geobacter sp.]|nr:MerR family transcriptional regulator [Geobacter sp.]
MVSHQPDKLYYKIGEVSRLLGLKPSVLRFWEQEFPQLKPRKSSTGQRLYAKRELDLLQQLKGLVYGDKLTLEGARKVIAQPQQKTVAEDTQQVHIQDIKKLLIAVKEELYRLRREMD